MSNSTEAHHRLVVLISGNGSNLQAIMDAIHDGDIPNTTIALVISNKSEAYGLTRATRAGIPTQVLSPTSYPDRIQYDSALAALIRKAHPNAIILAGFMRILSRDFVSEFTGKLLNIHPSLLPKYRGLNTHQRALEAGDVSHGCTVHLVTEALDEGPILAQSCCNIAPGDTEASLAERVHRLEHELYPRVIADFVAGKYDSLKMTDQSP